MNWICSYRFQHQNEPIIEVDGERWCSACYAMIEPEKAAIAMKALTTQPKEEK
ncbi:hypothetical protein SEA_MERCEDES_21 [Microbacterium phage Mercedes]|nr:hypothetical protein SEA_MERCEDES_21 [Microbacterium phage Mercedes]